MTQDNKSVTIEDYRNALGQLRAAEKIFTDFCYRVHGRNTALYMLMPEKDTPEIRAVRNLYKAYTAPFFRIVREYHLKKMDQ